MFMIPAYDPIAIAIMGFGRFDRYGFGISHVAQPYPSCTLLALLTLAPEERFPLSAALSSATIRVLVGKTLWGCGSRR